MQVITYIDNHPYSRIESDYYSDINWLIRLVESITYKNGWSASLYFSPKLNEHIRITFSYTTIDVNSNKEKLFNFSNQISQMVLSTSNRRDYLLKALFEIVRNAEIHECQEWFKVDGKNLYDPHKGENR